MAGRNPGTCALMACCGVGPVMNRGDLSVRGLSVAYRGQPALRQISGTFVAGSHTAVIGPNGAGKSSLLSALAGTVRPSEGVIERCKRQRVAYLPQVTALDRDFPVRVNDVVAMGLWSHLGCFGAVTAKAKGQVHTALAAVGMTGFDRRLVGELSTGQLQRVLFARAIAQNARIVLLDEPFNSVDAQTSMDLMALLGGWKREGRTVIAVLHDLTQVQAHFDTTLLLARELVAWGPTDEVVRPAQLERARAMAESWDDTQNAFPAVS
jgi:zinc/manganese transport system ATP-binding protein